jgi:CheY-like chemotaxis protein/HPt (histidine-containing phosphotransfer) domain-containing protein
MGEDRPGPSALEERLAAVKKAMEAGLPERALSLHAAADRLSQGHGSARADLKRLAHKLRGIVGSFGYQQLSSLASELEQKAASGSTADVVSLAREIARLSQEAARDSGKNGADRERTPAAAGRPRIKGKGSGRRQKQPAAARDGRAASAPAIAAESAPARARGPGARPERGSSSRLRVLAVDDEESDRMLLELTLGRLGGFEAFVVDSPLKALEMLRRERFDLVMADAMMPELNGMQFIRSARENSRAVDLPIVILSAASPDELGWEMGGEEPTAWLRKPFVPRELVAELLRILERGR